MRERDHTDVVEVKGRVILKRILKKWVGEAWAGLIILRKGTDGGRS